MDRNIPDVWNIFSLSGPNYGNGRQPKPTLEGFHHNWTHRNTDVLMKWCDRSSACDRPRTYDRFYQKTPGNFHDPHSDSGLCSSEEDEEVEAKHKKKKKRKLQYSRTVTERDVKHLERHLSMKKTIRKKIMRDLQQAFVENQVVDLHSLNFDPKRQNHEPKFLDVLRDDDSGHASEEDRQRLRDSSSEEGDFDAIVRVEEEVVKKPVEKSKRSFWQIITGKNKNKDKQR